MVTLKERLDLVRVVPVLRVPDQSLAQQGAEWLLRAGLDVLEVTMTLPDAPTLIEQLRLANPEALIGAGTVLSGEDTRAVIAAGAQFVVSPCLVPEVAEICQACNVPMIAGAATPREVLLAHQAGSEVVKIFPAKSAGGPGLIKTLKAVFPQIALMPTGGVRPEEVSNYIRAGALCVGLGSELLPLDPLRQHNEPLFIETVQHAMAAAGR